MAHLVLPDTQADPSQNQKSHFLPTHPKTYAIFANICQDNIIIMVTQFGERIRELRTKQNMLLRQLASLLDVDTSIISKVERGDRQLKKEQIPLLAEILKASSDELMTLWLADQIYAVVKDEKLANEAMDIAEGQLKNKNKRLK
jgi:transcriptional regulator with XRE-family HTH domain